MIIHTYDNGDQIRRKEKGLIFSFAGKRHVLSSSVLNGGWRDDLKYVFNFDEKPDGDKYCEMTEATYEEHLINIAKEKLDLDPDFASGLSTAADMDNMVIESKTVILSNNYPLTVTAAVTGGIDENGARPGDPPCWEEIDSGYRMLDDFDMETLRCDTLAGQDVDSLRCDTMAGQDVDSLKLENIDGQSMMQESQFKNPQPGTINIILHINASLTEGAMVRSVITGSEAKAVACSELLCPSLYSEGIATGSGTDGMIVICDPSTPFTLTAAGKDSLLGEMIGTTIIKALKKAIGLQTDVTPEYQHHVLKRLDRFGITEDTLYAIYMNQSFLDFMNGQKVFSKEAFLEKGNDILKSGYWVGKASMIAHLLDQLAWNMISMEDIREMYPMLFGKEGPVNLDKEILLQEFCVELVDNIIKWA